jgi:hypothetical protein
LWYIPGVAWGRTDARARPRVSHVPWTKRRSCCEQRPIRRTRTTFRHHQRKRRRFGPPSPSTRRKPNFVHHTHVRIRRSCRSCELMLGIPQLFDLRRSSLPTWVPTVPLANRFNRPAMITCLCTCRYVKKSRDKSFGHRGDPVSNDRRMYNPTALLSPMHTIKRRSWTFFILFLRRSFGRQRTERSCCLEGSYATTKSRPLPSLMTIEVRPESRRKVSCRNLIDKQRFSPERKS